MIEKYQIKLRNLLLNGFRDTFIIQLYNYKKDGFKPDLTYIFPDSGSTLVYMADGEILKQLIEYDETWTHQDIINAPNKKGHTTIFKYANKGQYVNIITWLINHGANIYHQDNHGFTILHWASKYHNLEVIRYLIVIAKMDVNLPSGKWKLTPLINCVNKEIDEVFETIKLLVSIYNADVNLVDINGLNILFHLVSETNAFIIIQWLLDNKPEINRNCKSINGKTIIFYAKTIKMFEYCRDCQLGSIYDVDIHGNSILNNMLRESLQPTAPESLIKLIIHVIEIYDLKVTREDVDLCIEKNNKLLLRFLGDHGIM